MRSFVRLLVQLDRQFNFGTTLASMLNTIPRVIECCCCCRRHRGVLLKVKLV